MTQYLYRTDPTRSLIEHASDQWLRARRIEAQAPPIQHWQLDEALAVTGHGRGVFRLSMWRTLNPALLNLRMQVDHVRFHGDDKSLWDCLSLLQRVRADHSFFRRYQRGDDQYLSGDAWLFWNTAECTKDQKWSSDGIPRSDIEVFHPHGYWAPYEQIVLSPTTPPAPLPGWIRCILAPAYEGEPERTVDARWVDHPSLGRCVFARVPVSSPGLWPSGYRTRRLLEEALLEVFPDLGLAGRLFVAVERTGYTQTYDITVSRTPAFRASRVARWFLGASDRPASASLSDDEVLAPGDPLVESLYRAGGIDPAALGASAFAYGPEALAILEREAAADGPTSHGC